MKKAICALCSLLLCVLCICPSFAAQGEYTLTLQMSGSAAVGEPLTEEEARAVLSTVPQAAVPQLSAGEDGLTQIVLDGGDDALCEQLFFAFAEARRPILRMAATRATLEDVFLELTESEAAPPKEEPKRSWLPRRKQKEPDEKETEAKNDAGDL